MQLYPAANQLDRETALRLWTESNTWFSTEVGKKGQIKNGQLADLAVLSDDYFSVPGEAIQDIASVLTLVGGKAVSATPTSRTWRRHCRPRCPTGPRYALSAAIKRGRAPTSGANTPSRPPADAVPPAACMDTRMHGD
jgi:hypothetical protein